MLSSTFSAKSEQEKFPMNTEGENNKLYRMSTPKPVMHLGSAIEPQKTGSSAVPSTPFRNSTEFRSSTALIKPPSSLKGTLRSSTRTGTSNLRSGTATVLINRPMTAVRGAGYTSHGRTFDPALQAATMPVPPLELQKDDTPEERIRQQEAKIMELVEESCKANAAGDFRRALSKAKEASNKERSLIKIQEQAKMAETHNMDLTFEVLFNLGNQYAANELYQEALNTYQMIIKNRMFTNGYRLKINMGNIYFKQGRYDMAIKMFRMALDQMSNVHKNLRIKIMHNIAMVFIKMGQWIEAVTNLEYIMSEQACHRAGLHLVVCCRALEDTDQMKNAFNSLLSVPMNMDDEDKYNVEQDNPEESFIARAIRNDDLHRYEIQKRREAEYCILNAAKLIAPLIGDSFSAGYDWCVATIKKSEYARLASELEINKAVMFLKQKQLPEAVSTLKAFEKDSNIAINAAVNLSFIYFLQGDYDTALTYGQVVESSIVKTPEGYVNLGACFMAQGQLEKAINCFETALELAPNHFEATYNLGLALKNQGHFERALECFQQFTGSLALLPCVIYQTGHLLDLMQDAEAAADTYQQLLGLVPADAEALQKLGELYDREGDKQQAYHYHLESFRYFPANLSVIEWLGSYYIEMQVVEKALVYFEKAAIMQPNEPKWNMMVAACYRRSGNMHRALTLYQAIHKQFPENAECLRYLVRLCSDLGMREAQDYVMELKKLERTKEVRERVNSSRPGSRRTSRGLTSSASSGFSVVLENVSSPRNSAGRNLDSSRMMDLRNSAGSNDSGLENSDTSYLDPLGPQPTRPRTGMGKPLDFEDFDNEELGDDLLPE
ncbi:intraflagellar transport protein 88 homolog isoform X2 [Harmonia axyridis]|uniref:intraflagellar transport protein 88 homolog isoform X2 n=1 Tax=Harmonia axyridis TaxID=115357 RepID=UPI001E277054|nr:intraflagellar transport protein 88 homolog isoform X2 [Harmonia axyridis]